MGGDCAQGLTWLVVALIVAGNVGACVGRCTGVGRPRSREQSQQHQSARALSHCLLSWENGGHFPPQFVGTPPPVGVLPPRWTGPPLRSVGLRWALKPRTRPVHYKMTLIYTSHNNMIHVHVYQ